MASLEARDDGRAEWSGKARELIRDLSAVQTIHGENAFAQGKIEEIEKAISGYVESSRALGEVLSTDLQESTANGQGGSPLLPGLYDPIGALLSVCAADLAFAVTFISMDPDTDHGSLKGWQESERVGLELATKRLEVRVFEAEQAVAGHYHAGASGPGVPLELTFVEAAISKLVVESGRTISSVFTRVALFEAVGVVADNLLKELPKGLSHTLEAAAANISFIRRQVVRFIGVALDKLSAWLGGGGGGVAVISQGKTWLESRWAHLRDVGIAAKVLHWALQADQVDVRGRSLLRLATEAQLIDAEASLTQLQHRHGKRLVYAGHAVTALGLLNALSFLPDPSKVVVLAGAGAVIFGTAWMCADAIDSPSLGPLTQRTDGVIGRIQHAMT